jgi:hypothetical protein
MTRPPTTARTNESARPKALSALLIAAGVGVIAISFVWPTRATQRRAWSMEQAKQYKAAAGKLHSLSHEITHADANREAAVRQELNTAQAEYDALRRDLDAALSRPRRWAWIMRSAGILAICIGGAVLFTLPKDES